MVEVIEWFPVITTNTAPQIPQADKKQSWLGKRFSYKQTTVPTTWELRADDGNWNAFDQLILVLSFKWILSGEKEDYMDLMYLLLAETNVYLMDEWGEG